MPQQSFRDRASVRNNGQWRQVRICWLVPFCELRGLRGATKRMSELELQSSGGPLNPHTDFKYKEDCGLERREGTSPTSPPNLRAEPAPNAHFLLSGEHFTFSVTSRVPCCRESRFREEKAALPHFPSPCSPGNRGALLLLHLPSHPRELLRGLAATSGSNNVCNSRRVSKFCQVCERARMLRPPSGDYVNTLS